MPGDHSFHSQQPLADPHGMGIGDAVTDIIGQRAQVGDMVVEPLELDQQRSASMTSSDITNPSASSIARRESQRVTGEVSPQTRSASSTASVAGRPSKNFSTPRWMNHNRALSFRIVSPTTENRK